MFKEIYWVKEDVHMIPCCAQYTMATRVHLDTASRKACSEHPTHQVFLTSILGSTQNVY